MLMHTTVPSGCVAGEKTRLDHLKLAGLCAIKAALRGCVLLLANGRAPGQARSWRGGRAAVTFAACTQLCAPDRRRLP